MLNEKLLCEECIAMICISKNVVVRAINDPSFLTVNFLSNIPYFPAYVHDIGMTANGLFLSFTKHSNEGWRLQLIVLALSKYFKFTHDN